MITSHFISLQVEWQFVASSTPRGDDSAFELHALTDVDSLATLWPSVSGNKAVITRVYVDVSRVNIDQLAAIVGTNVAVVPVQAIHGHAAVGVAQWQPVKEVIIDDDD